MARWEYARLESTERGINVVFTHRQAWTGLAPEAFFQTLGQLGDEGWELVAALPLQVSATTVPAPAPPPLSRDAREVRDPREARPDAVALPQSMTLQLTPDRWLVFKRPIPEPPAEPASNQGAEMLKGIVGRQLLKGRLPLP